MVNKLMFVIGLKAIIAAVALFFFLGTNELGFNPTILGIVGINLVAFSVKPKKK